MKQFTAIIVLALLAGCAGPRVTAGIDDADAEDGAQVITTATGTSRTEAYQQIGDVLSQGGYEIVSSDATLGTLRTDWKWFNEGGGAIYILRIAATAYADGRVALRGYRQTISGETPVSKGGAPRSERRLTWKRLHEIADALGAKHTYGM